MLGMTALTLGHALGKHRDPNYLAPNVARSFFFLLSQSS